MKVLVSDKLADIGIKMFDEAEGVDVDVKVGLTPEELKAIIEDYEALVIRSATKVTEDLLNAATRLKVIGRAGIGLDNVDIPAATKQGVAVMNTPGGNVVTTAEHTIAMILALSRNNLESACARRRGDLVGVDAGRVYDEPRLHQALVRLDRRHAPLPDADARGSAVEQECHAVIICVVGKGEDESVRT